MMQHKLIPKYDKDIAMWKLKRPIFAMTIDDYRHFNKTEAC